MQKKQKGLFVGESHANGGIPSKVAETNQLIEIEGDEYYICKRAYNSSKKFSFRKKSNKEILDHIYTSFACKLQQDKMQVGDFIICKVVVKDKSKVDRQGTVKSILNSMQREKQCRVEDAKDVKLYKGGELTEYNKWKAVDWNNLKGDTKKRSNIYRFIGWYNSDRIDWEKMSQKEGENDKEWFEDDFLYELNDDATLDYIFRDNIKDVENEFGELLGEDGAETDKGINKLLKTEYKDLKSNIDSLGLTWKDVESKSTDELVEKVTEDKDQNWIVDYFILNDDNWEDFEYVFGEDSTDKIDNLYVKALDNGAVFTEEAEMQQFDLFKPVESTQSVDNEEIENIEFQIDMLSGYLSTTNGLNEDEIDDIEFQIQILQSALKELKSNG
tara:strand:- start:4674 stop:5831 length:1158 start_codon:yes stop_codon:yes gene_type:complete